MELNNLLNVVVLFVLVGMVVGVGVLAMDKFSTATREVVTVVNESFTSPQINKTVSLANGNMSAFISVTNTTGAILASGNYTIDLDAGTLNNTGNQTPCLTGTTCYANYKYYDYNTDAATALNAGMTELSGVSTTWLGLIITIVILAIIIGLVINGFAGKKR